jgi:biopolymer transport protein ExbB
MDGFWSEFCEYFNSGGPLMYPIALLACYLYYIGFDLLLSLFKINADSDTPEILLSKAGLSESLRPKDRHERRLGIKKDFDLLRLSLMPQIERGIKTIGILAAVAPLLGLLGTVSGMTLAIATMGEASGGVSDGVSRALITTQCGLLVAIPALVMRLACSRLRQKILIKISRYESSLIMEGASA